MNSKKENQQYRMQMKAYRKEKRRALHHAKGLSVLFGILSFICVILVIITTLFDQTFYIITGSNYYKVKKGSEAEAAAYYTSDFENSEERKAYGRDVCEQVENEGAVLLMNENNALPLENGSSVSLFSQGSVNLVYGGTGSGAVDDSNAVNLKEALEEEQFLVNQKLWDFYESGDGSEYERTTMSIQGGGSYWINEVPWDVYPTDVIDSISSYGDAAVAVIGRIGGEGGDLPTSDGGDAIDGNYLSLNEDERTMLQELHTLKKQGDIKKIIVLINSANPLEVDFLSDDAYGIDACLWIGDVGETGTRGVANILSGSVTPSGHLADTYCRTNLTSPAVANFGAYQFSNASSMERDAEEGCSDYYLVYAEGIYVGYRYYETRYEDTVMGTGNSGDYQYASDVAYPFGYGLSYTTFSHTNLRSQYLADTDQFRISVDVTNTGDTYSGKDAVQIYVQSPYTDYDKDNHVEKASATLCGFTKTDLLEPGETQTVEILVDRRDIASYDAYGSKTYILDAGTWYFTAAHDTHNAVNNILSAKGFSPDNTAGRMDAYGDSAMVFTWDNPSFDSSTYATSKNTNAQITNQFDNVDLNLYDGGSQSITYLSRSDWQGTFPSPITDLEITEQMAEDLANRRYDSSDYEEAEMPVMEADNGRKLIEYRGVDFDDPSWDELLDQMSYEEMADLVGNAFHLTKPVTSIGLPGTFDENGPNGLTTRLMLGTVDSTAFTSEDVIAATWNTDLAAEVGECIGEDCLANGYAGLYGPGNNIHRTPYGGRNFEYYSEDGFLSGKISEKEISAIQENGTYVFMKHAVLNEGETQRTGLSTWANEQSIREIYLKAFQYPMEANDTAGVMTAMPRLGYSWAGAHEGMITNVFRKEWGSKAMFISDNTTTHVFMDGLDAVMAGSTLFDAMMGKQYAHYMKDGKDDPVIANALREACHYNLYSIVNSHAMNGITEDDTIVRSYPAWLIGIRIAAVLFIGLFFWQLVLAILRTRKFKASHQKPQKISEQ